MGLAGKGGPRTLTRSPGGIIGSMTTQGRRTTMMPPHRRVGVDLRASFEGARDDDEGGARYSRVRWRQRQGGGGRDQNVLRLKWAIETPQ